MSCILTMQHRKSGMRATERIFDLSELIYQVAIAFESRDIYMYAAHDTCRSKHNTTFVHASQHATTFTAFYTHFASLL